MKPVRAVPRPVLNTIPHMPSWVTAGRGETLEDVAFLSGAALAHLHVVMARDEVPHALVRERLALRAAEACMVFSGRPERAGELRDALHLLRSGDLPGPAGEAYLSWRRAVARPVSVKSLQRAFPACDPSEIAGWLDAGRGGPVAQAALVMETVLKSAPKSEPLALVLAEAVLAQALGWPHLTPLFAVGFHRNDLRKRGADLHVACHRALRVACIEAARLANDLTWKTAHLNAVAPKLRAKGAGKAMEMFLTQDVVAPTALPLPDRSDGEFIVLEGSEVLTGTGYVAGGSK